MAFTPMMRQYFDLKEQHPDCLLFFRLGDFYEMFFDDAELVSRELELTLTGRDCGMDKRAPMCGVPYHAVDNYIKRLIENGHKVAICEQLQDPNEVKGLVERGIVRIITPGTATDSGDEDENRYIMCVWRRDGAAGAAYADVSTGEFLLAQPEDEAALFNLLLNVRPKELLYEDGEDTSIFSRAVPEALLSAYQPFAFGDELAQETLKKHFGVASLTIFGVEEAPEAICAAGALMRYLLETQKNMLRHITRMAMRSEGTGMTLDSFTKRNLELTQSMQSKQKKGSLLWLLDKTKTSMGSRLIRSWIERPLISKKAINERLDAVDELKKDLALRADIKNALSGVSDIERLLSRISYNNLDARHALSLRQSIEKIPSIKELLKSAASPMLARIALELDPLPELFSFLDAAVPDDPPLGIRDGGIIKNGFSAEVDKLRDAQKNGRAWISQLEQREREHTGISKLKVGYNKVFGYYIEVSRANSDSVPYEYVRKQTLANCERYITQELKELEDTVIGAQEKCCRLETELFGAVREHIAGYINELQKNARLLAELDVLDAFAQAAYDYGYVRPHMNDKGKLLIKDGRHPVVERAVRMEFVPNDAEMDDDKNRVLVITGPNMAGKSTFMRQTGLIVLMAHMGCFVPAKSADICMMDRVFTRVGASDDLASGQSTFMVEMNELATILLNSTSKSLLLLDEIGRGTSTLDGLAIAWATIEFIVKNNRGKTLFATHFHELTDLEGLLEGVVNYSVGVKELMDTVVFLHRIKRGGADRSFGIEVAKLAGLPGELLSRSAELLTMLQQNSGIELSKMRAVEKPRDEEEGKKLAHAASMLRAIDINTVTPLEALTLLADLKQKVE